jgi:hypothetical protein
MVRSVEGFQNKDHSFIGSDCRVKSDDSACGCSCVSSFRIISWQECDTLSKKIGFIFGQVINFMSKLVSKTYSFINKIIKTVYIDKLFEIFYKTIKRIFNKSLVFTKWIFENCIKPIFTNKITKKIVELLRQLSHLFNNYVINSLVKINRKILPKVSAIINREISRKFLNFIKNEIITICNWTIVPAFNVIGDIFTGIVSGISQKNKSCNKEQPVE